MISNDYPVYDFSSAGSVSRSLSKPLEVWLGKFNEIFVERWTDFSIDEIEVTRTQIGSKSFAEAQAGWKVPCFGLPFTIDSNSMTGLLVAERIEILGLLMEILGDHSTEIADREFTSVEHSLCQMILEQSANILAEAWPQQDPLSITTEVLDVNASRSRLFDGRDEMILSGFMIKSSNGQSKIQWVFPKKPLEQLLAVESSSAEPTRGPAKIPMDNISRLAVTVSATLGSTKMDMTELMSIAPGDIVILDQPIGSPIVLSVNDQPVFEAWPGRVGNKQGLQVESFVS